MCGLSGAMGDLNLKEEKIFKTLLVFSSVRGIDSTGCASVAAWETKHHRKITVAKEVGSPFDLFNTKRFDEVFKGNACVFMGHNRYKTIGDVTRYNAHPFEFEDVLGTHNGSLDWTNKNRLEAGSTFGTDSEAIFNNIQIHGIKDTISRIDKTEAYALVWYDRRDHTLNFIRNDKRPLFYCYANQRKVLFWCSEVEILYAAMFRENLKPDEKIYSLPADTHFRWNCPATYNEKLGQPERTQLQNRVYTAPVNLNNRSSDSGCQKMFPNNKNSNNDVSGITDRMSKPGYDPDKEYNDDIDGLFDTSDPAYELVDGVWRLKKTSSMTPEKHTSAYRQAAEKALKDLQQKGTTIKNGKTGEVIQLDGPAFLRRRAWDQAKTEGKAPIKTGTDVGLYERYASRDVKVFKAFQEGKVPKWIWHTYDDQKHEWVRQESLSAPECIPFKLVDLNSRHCFKHIGKKKKKVIYYRGYNGKLIDYETFEHIMSNGCYNCNREPHWGNEVTFFSANHDFLCEYCSEDNILKNECLKLGKQVHKVDNDNVEKVA